MEQSRPSRSRIALGVGLGLAVVAILVLGRARSAPLEPAASVSPVTEKIVVEVRNGTDRPGLARQVTRLLRERGVDVVYFGTAPSRADSTRILVRRGPQSRGTEVARVLGQGRVVTVPDSSLRVDITIVLGADYRFPAHRLPL